jgi:hypothetical protein
MVAAAELLSSIQPLIEESTSHQPIGQIYVPLYDRVEGITFSEDEFIPSDILIFPMTVTQTVIINDQDEVTRTEELPQAKVDPILIVPDTERPPPVKKFDVQSPFLRGKLRKEVVDFAEATGTELHATGSSQVPAEVTGKVAEGLPTSTSPMPVVAIGSQSPVPHPTNLRRAIIMGKRQKQCVLREKGPMKRLAQPLDSELCQPPKKTAPSGEIFIAFVDILAISEFNLFVFV